jgi:hypothetical protein
MRRIGYAPTLLVVLLLATTMTFAATRQWQTGHLIDTEQEKVKDGSITHYNTGGQAKNRNNGKADYSENTTATTTDNIDTFEVYTIQAADKTYIAREKLLFPWSKPASVTVGAEVKFAVEGRKLIILGDDQKEHKASIVKTTLNQPK